MSLNKSVTGEFVCFRADGRWRVCAGGGAVGAPQQSAVPHRAGESERVTGFGRRTRCSPQRYGPCQL